MKPNPVGWFEIYVQDMERAKAFYEAVFETRLTKLDNPEVELWGFPMEMDRMGCPGALVKIPGCPSGGNSVVVYFACEDCGVEAKRVVAHGGSLHRDKFSIGPYGFIALAVDTEGNMFGLHSRA
jgi:uncharacterized protein